MSCRPISLGGGGSGVIWIPLIVAIVASHATSSLLPGKKFRSLDDQSGGDMFGQSTTQLLRLRGFGAINYNVTVNEDFTLNLVRIVNPFTNIPDKSNNNSISTRRPVLFVHGLLASANWFLLNSIDARPRNLTHLLSRNEKARNLTYLMETLGDDPTSKSLPMLMSNFGYDVWLLNRRPTLESQAASNRPKVHDHDKGSRKTPFEKADIYFALHAALLRLVVEPGRSFVKLIRSFASRSALKRPLLSATSEPELLLNEIVYNLETFLMPNVRQKTFNAGYWHFSLDEQARFDLPKVIDFILNETQQSKMDIVGHSLGGALPLMTLSTQPEYQEKVSRCILFAPAVDLGKTRLLRPAGAREFENFLQTVNGPVVAGVWMPILQTFFANFCVNKLIQRIMCVESINLIVGPGSEQLELHPGTYFASPTTSSSHELVQLAQSIEKRHLHYYDYRNYEQNMIAYNQSSPPRYEMGNIKKTHLIIYGGNTDNSVSPETMKILIGSLRAPYDYILVNITGVKINHMAYQFHKKVATLINIPLVHSLESSAKGG